MKSVTLDFELYEKELKEKFDGGAGHGTKAFKEAERLIKAIVRNDYSVKTQDFYIWLRDFGTK